MTAHPKPVRVKNQKLMTEYHSLECIICGQQATPAHIKGRGARGDDVRHNMAPLCGGHHTEQGTCGMTTFSVRYAKFKEWLLNNGWQFCEVALKWRHYGGT